MRKFRSLISEKPAFMQSRFTYSLSLIFFLFAAGIMPLRAQTTYNFECKSSPFTPISGTTLTWTDLDNSFNNAIPIGFNFNFFGTPYSTVSVSTNGWLTFGQNITNSARNNILSSGGTRPLLAPLWDDLSMQNSNDFSYTTEGTAGSRIFTAQWLNMKWGFAATGAVISFQVKLYESSGMIDFIYRQESNSVYNGSASIGIAAAGTGSGNFYSVQNTTSSATASTSSDITSLNTKPATNQVFSFTPASGALVELDSSSPSVLAADIVQNSADNIIYRFDCIVTQSDAIMTGLQVTISGTYAAGDISYLNAWYSDDAIFSPATDVLLSRKTSSFGPGLQVFPEFEPQQINVNTTGHIFITASLNCSSVAGNTIIVNAVTTADVTFQSGTKTGSTFAGGAQTIQNSVPNNVQNPSATHNGTTANISWSNPAGCYDEIMIVAKISSITANPSGNGSAYTANNAYGSGTAFDGGSVVYKGKASPQTITSLLEGTTYYFKFFTRNGTNWSNGSEINITTTAAATGNFRSVASGNWSSTSTWEYYNGTSWGPAASAPKETSGSISIISGHNVTITADVMADQVVVDAGGTLTINNLVTFTLNDGTGTDCTVNGTLVNSGNIAGTGSISFNGTGIYNHARDGGQVPTASWNTGSTCRITGSTTNAPSNLNQPFYNFTWNCSGQTGIISLGGYPSSISGTFTLISTGTGYLSPGGNVTYINYLQTGGTFSILNGIATPLTITVGNFTLQGGLLEMSDAPAIGTLNLSGNFTHTSGGITVSSASSGNIVFNGTSMQTYTSGGSITGLVNITVNPKAYLQMASESTVVPSEGGTFTLSNTATLGITSSAGINSGNIGNIQTNSKNFGTGANYLYNGSGPQNTGGAINFATLTGNITVASSSVLTATGNLTINGSLTVNGTLIPNSASRIFSGTGTLNGNGTVIVTRTASGADFLTQYQITNKTLTNLTVEYAAATGGQTISPLTYGNLKLSNTSGTNVLGGNVTVNSTLTTTANGTLNVSSGYLLSAANVANAGILTITGTGKATIGNLVNNGTLNLNSTASTQNFSLIMDSYSGAGTANISLYLTGGGDPNYKFHYVAVPATTTTTVFTGGVNDNLELYDESKVTSTINDGWMWHDGYENTTPFTSMSVKQGYAFYHPDASALVNFNGLNSLQTTLGTISLAYSGTNPAIHGFNLLGNSLTCGIDWNQVTETGDVDNTVYYLKDWKEATYLRNVGGINGATKDIPPLQGFIVKANATGTSLNFTNARQHTSQERYKKGFAESDSKNEADATASGSVPLVRLTLNNLVIQDETLIWFSEKATNAFEGDLDARKFFSNDSFDQIYTFAGPVSTGINGLPLPAETTIIPVAVQFLNSGTNYKIVASELQGLDKYNVTLTDKYSSNLVTDLKVKPEYSFSSVAGTFTDRFFITITTIVTSSKNDITIDDEQFNIYTSGNTLNIKPLNNNWEGKKSIMTIYNLSGNKMFMDNQSEWVYGDLKQYNLDIPKGMYIVEIKSQTQRFVSKINLNF